MGMFIEVKILRRPENQGGSQQKTFRLTQDGFWVGAGPMCECRIPVQGVLKRHIRVEYTPDALQIQPSDRSATVRLGCFCTMNCSCPKALLGQWTRLRPDEPIRLGADVVLKLRAVTGDGTAPTRNWVVGHLKSPLKEVRSHVTLKRTSFCVLILCLWGVEFLVLDTLEPIPQLLWTWPFAILTIVASIAFIGPDTQAPIVTPVGAHQGVKEALLSLPRRILAGINARRLDRTSFCVLNLCLLCLHFVPFLVLAIFGIVFQTAEPWTPTRSGAVLYVLNNPSFILFIFASIARLRHVGRSPWWLLLMYQPVCAPYLYAFGVFYLITAKGKQHEGP